MAALPKSNGVHFSLKRYGKVMGGGQGLLDPRSAPTLVSNTRALYCQSLEIAVSSGKMRTKSGSTRISCLLPRFEGFDGNPAIYRVRLFPLRPSGTVLTLCRVSVLA
jgi:hypothetical protein